MSLHTLVILLAAMWLGATLSAKPTPANFPICAAAADGNNINLACSNSYNGGSQDASLYYISSINFASYGRPTGQCNSTRPSTIVPFAVNPQCFVYNAMLYTQGQCLNKYACSFPIAATTFPLAGYFDTNQFSVVGCSSRTMLIHATCTLVTPQKSTVLFEVVTPSDVTIRCPSFLGPNAFIAQIYWFVYGTPYGVQFDVSSTPNYSNYGNASALSSQLAIVEPGQSSSREQSCACTSRNGLIPGGKPNPWSNRCDGLAVLAQLRSSCVNQPTCYLPVSAAAFRVNWQSCHDQSFSTQLYLQGLCASCPAGTYTVTSTRSPTHAPTKSALAAAPGSPSPTLSYTPSPTQPAKLCRNCPDGYFAPAQGLSACLPVPLGAQGMSGFGASDGSNAGGYKTTKAAKGYSACPAYSYRDATSGTSCVPCPRGAISLPQALPTYCRMCPPGTAPSLYTCTNCTAGFYAQPSMSACMPTPGGFFPTSDMNSFIPRLTGAAGYSPCPAGAFSSGISVGVGEGAGSEPAPGSDSSASMPPPTVCEPCAAGTYSSAPGQAACRSARPGEFISSAGMTAPKKCDPGTYAPSGGGVACVTCIYPSYSNTTGETGCPYVYLEQTPGSLASILVSLFSALSLVFFADALAWSLSLTLSLSPYPPKISRTRWL